MLGIVSARWMSPMAERPPRKKAGTAVAKSAPAREQRGNQASQGAESVRMALEEEFFLLQCIEQMRGRDQVALGKLYDATAARVHGVILRIARLPELAEEVLADVYLQAWRDCDRYDPARGKVIAWLLIIARTRSLDALRRADEAFSHPAPEDLLTGDALVDSAKDPASMLEVLQDNSALQEALDSLSAIQRQLVALAFFKGLSHAEIATHASLPLGSVKTHIRKALNQLRERLAKSGEQDRMDGMT